MATDAHHLPNGPYRVLHNSTNGRTHAMDIADKTVCGWRPRITKHTVTHDAAQWLLVHSKAVLCKRCCRHLTLPHDWEKPTRALTDASAPTSSTSQDSD